MKITDLEIDGFGVWSGLKIEELSDRITVFYGPNEAGKTTLTQFIRSMFYGISSARRLRYLPPLRGGRPGGSLHVHGDEGAFQIARHTDDASSHVVGRVGKAQQHYVASLRSADTRERHVRKRKAQVVCGSIDEKHITP